MTKNESRERALQIALNNLEVINEGSELLIVGLVERIGEETLDTLLDQLVKGTTLLCLAMLLLAKEKQQEFLVEQDIVGETIEHIIAKHSKN